MRKDLLPLAKDVVATAVQSLSNSDIRQLLGALSEIQKNLHATISQLDEIKSKIIK
jgi:hypothetical protein